MNELVGDTSKVFICNDPRNNATALELFEHVYGAALEKLPEELMAELEKLEKNLE